MKGIGRILGTSFLILGVLLPSFSSPLQAQTAEELKRVEELRKREHEVQQEIQQRLLEVREERLARIEEALVRAKEQLAQAESGSREVHAARLQEMERALAEAQAQMEMRHLHQEELLAYQMDAQAEAMAKMEQGQRQFERAKALEYEAQLAARAGQEEAYLKQAQMMGLSRARFQEAREQAREQERKVRELVVSVRGRARLGVSLNGSQGEEIDRQGVRVDGVMADTPAEEAGIQEGDIITHLKGHALVDPIPGEEDEGFDDSASLPVQRLVSMAGDLDAGEEVEIRYMRNGERHSVTLEAADLDEPSIMVFGGDLEELEGRRILRVGPEGEGRWSFRMPDDEVVRLKLSELEDLHDLEDLRIHLKDMKVDLEDMHLDLRELDELEDLNVRLKELYVDSPNLRIMARPEGLGRGYTVLGGDSPLAYSVLGGTMRHGLKVTNLNPGLAEYFSTDSGLLVLEVDEDSTLGLVAGDVILAIGGREVEEQGDLRRILSSYEDGEAISFHLVRKGQEVEVEGRIR